MSALRSLYFPSSGQKNSVWFSHVARAHRWVAPLTKPSRRPMAARCQALPSTQLSDTQQQSGTSNPGRPARAVSSHPTLNLRKALETQTQPDSSLTLYAPAGRESDVYAER
eukprot:scaffold10099_cov137-Isochrysis_galbana.AAC.3